MPAQRTQSVLKAKFGTKLAQMAAKAAEKEIDYGRQGLPGGISLGTAQVSDCKFEVFKAGSNAKQADGSSAVGEVYFSLRGVVHEPEFAPNGERVRGRQVGFIQSMPTKGLKRGQEVWDSQKCLDEIINFYLKKLAGPDADYHDPEGVAGLIEDAKPFFHFKTRSVADQKKPDEFRVFEDFLGLAEGYDPTATGDGVDDGTAEPAKSGDTFNTFNEFGEVSTADDPQSTDTADGPEPGSDEELVWLVEQCGPAGQEVAEGSPEETSQLKLTEIAEAAGVNDDDIGAAADWQALADLIRAARDTASDPGPAEPEPEPEPVKPAVKGKKPAAPKPLKVGDLRKYTSAEAKVAVDVEILTIDGDVVTLKNIATGKTVVNKLKKPEKVRVADLKPV